MKKFEILNLDDLKKLKGGNRLQDETQNGELTREEADKPNWDKCGCLTQCKCFEANVMGFQLGHRITYESTKS